MTEQDRQEFIDYLKACTDAQVRAVLDKERGAGRQDFAQLAQEEMKARGL
jgi:hypothetical protein